MRATATRTCPLLLLLAAPPARADDRSVKAAWDGEDPAFGELRRGERLTGVVEGRVAAETASSEPGARAREIALESLDRLARAEARELFASVGVE